ncbi:hypothetical protein J4426_02090 [Candidatus Woesearchaeota archaeon]|nr:hypothetical protein [Candidatus Woesearchaeota archaeon]
MKRKKSYEEEILDEEGKDIYSDEGREAQLEDDEISDWEAGFMEGYEED